MLCDSIGLEPSPNNGTLRLPLKPVGLHDEVPAIEVPSDPVTSYTITPTPTPTLTPSPSVPAVGVDPVVTGDVSTPVTVDIPQDIGEGGDTDANAPPNSTGDAAKDFWDWAKDEFGKAWSWTSGKAGEVWDKIKGGDGTEKETQGR